MWESFITLFTDMGTVSLVLLIVAIIMMGVELCVAGFGVFGIISCVCYVAAIIARAIEGADVTQVCIMAILVLTLVFVSFWLVAILAKKGLLSRTGLVENGQVIEKQYESPKKKLLNKVGVTTCKCKPAGAVCIDGKEYDCIAEGSCILEGAEVRVVKVKDEEIFIKVLEGENK